MNAIILSVGDELVLGQTVDTNSAWISQHLSANGIDTRSHITVGDTQSEIENAIHSATGRADVLIISGGIGPTDDDVTRQALAAVMGVELVTDERWLNHITTWFARLGRPMPTTNAIQAMVPRGAAMIWNHLGTASGLTAMLGTTQIFVLPGVPKEMKDMFTRDVLPLLTKQAGGAAIIQRILHSFGAGESSVAEKLGDLMKRGRNPSVGTTVADGVVSIRISARFKDKECATREADNTVRAVRAALGDLIYGEDGASLAVTVCQLLEPDLPDGTPITVAAAESCTGGLLAKYLTDRPGASKHFNRGWITYANEAKSEELGVDAKLIDIHGAVSEPVAIAMARGAFERSSATYALSITGIAGPDGGTDEKPVGTVCIAIASRDETKVRTFVFPGDRNMIRDRSAKMAMTMLRFELLGKPMPF